MRDYLILRCPPLATLPLAQLRVGYFTSSYDYITSKNGLPLFTPTSTLQIRSGRSRKRETVVLPILPSFLFLRIPPDPDFNPISLFLPPNIRLMKRPLLRYLNTNRSLPPEIPFRAPSAYAYCSARDLSLLQSVDTPDIADSPFRVGQRVEVTEGLLKDVCGIITQIRSNGDISLKVQKDLGWQINTCIVNVNMLCCV